MSDVVLVALIAAIGPTAAVLVTWLLQRGQIRQIHEDTNGRLDAALKEIARLRGG